MAVPAIDKIKLPWDKEGVEFDPEQGRRFIYTLMVRADKAETELAERDTALTEAQAKVTAFESKDLTEVQRLTQENEALKKAKPVPAGKSRLEIAIEAAEELELTLTPTQLKGAAKRIAGESDDDLLTDAKEYIEEHYKVSSVERPPRRSPDRVSTGRVATGDETDNDTDPGAVFEKMTARGRV